MTPFSILFPGNEAGFLSAMTKSPSQYPKCLSSFMNAKRTIQPPGHSAQAWACIGLAFPGTTAAPLGTQRHMKFLTSIVFSLWISLYLPIGFKAERTQLLSDPKCCRVRALCPAGALAAPFGEGWCGWPETSLEGDLAVSLGRGEWHTWTLWVWVVTESREQKGCVH